MRVRVGGMQPHSQTMIEGGNWRGRKHSGGSQKCRNACGNSTLKLSRGDIFRGRALWLLSAGLTGEEEWGRPVALDKVMKEKGKASSGKK